MQISKQPWAATWENIDAYADTAPLLEKGSYKITSSEDVPFCYVLDDALALKGFTSVDPAKKEELVSMMPDAFDRFMAKDT